MQQLLHQSDPQTPSESYQSPSHYPKIKPILQRYYKPNPLDETNYQKSLKIHSKTFRAVKTNRNKRRGPSVRYIKGYQKLLKVQESLSKLFYSINRHLYFENLYLFSKIRGLRNLSSLDVQSFTNRDNQIPLKVLFKSLASLKDLAHFKIELNFYAFNDAQTLRILFQSLQSLNKLKSLSLCLIQCSNFEKARIKKLPQYLSHLKRLRSFELSLDRSMELTDQDMISLASVLPKLPFLTQVKLDFGGQGREIQGTTLVRIFQSMNNLSSITLNLGNSEVISKELTNSLAQSLRKLHPLSLSKLSLHLNRNLSTQGLVELSQTLMRFTALSTLHLNLYGCGSLTNDGIAELSLALSSLITLSSFSFRVPHAIEADSIIGSIASGVGSLHHLVNLKLNFANIKTDPEQIQQLSASLMNLTGLQFIEIRFSWLQSLSDGIMETFAESLRKLVQLKHLSFDFGCAKMVTNEGVEALANAIQNLYSLSSLGLNLSVNQTIDHEAVEKIAQILRTLPSLYSTNFGLARCSKLELKMKSLSPLFKALGELENIREVTLYLTHNEFNKQEVSNLKQRKILAITW